MKRLYVLTYFDQLKEPKIIKSRVINHFVTLIAIDFVIMIISLVN